MSGSGYGRLAAAVLTCAALAACETTPPVITDLRTDKVEVQAEDRKDAGIAAAEGCAMHGRSARFLSRREHCTDQACSTYTVGSHASTTCSPAGCETRYLFACIVPYRQPGKPGDRS